MPSFDVVSEVDWQEVRNAVDQANREIANRYDFKGSDARVERAEDRLTVYGDDDYKVGQAVDILHTRLAKRGVDLGCLVAAPVTATSGGKAKQEIMVQHGINQETGKKIIKTVKETKLKVQASIQGEQVRITGKKRDDLQEIIKSLKGADFGVPLQYANFRD